MSSEPKKRGRKKKVVEENIIENIDDTKTTTEGPKKRGRKPKGGKIVPVTKNTNNIIEKSKNVILHLKCSLSDINNDLNNDDYNISNNLNEKNVILSASELNEDNYGSFLSNDNNNIINNEKLNENLSDKQEINKEYVLSKINKLKINLTKNNISDKRSACFWCTYEFHNPPIFIPKKQKHDGYEVYGCFCTPECGVAYLMNESIDSSIKFERYQMMNYIYCKSLKYESNIKPAPNPYYLLDKYYGNLTIEEYRSTLRNNNYLIFVEKPLTHIFPEMFIDNHDFTLMKDNSMTNSNSLSQYKIKKASTKDNKPKTKSEIVKEKFGGI